MKGLLRLYIRVSFPRTVVRAKKMFLPFIVENRISIVYLLQIDKVEKRVTVEDNGSNKIYSRYTRACKRRRATHQTGNRVLFACDRGNLGEDEQGPSTSRNARQAVQKGGTSAAAKRRALVFSGVQVGRAPG